MTTKPVPQDQTPEEQAIAARRTAPKCADGFFSRDDDLEQISRCIKPEDWETIEKTLGVSSPDAGIRIEIGLLIWKYELEPDFVAHQRHNRRLSKQIEEVLRLAGGLREAIFTHNDDLEFLLAAIGIDASEFDAQLEKLEDLRKVGPETETKKGRPPIHRRSLLMWGLVRLYRQRKGCLPTFGTDSGVRSGSFKHSGDFFRLVEIVERVAALLVAEEPSTNYALGDAIYNALKLASKDARSAAKRGAGV